MKNKYRFRRILSGVMAAVTILSTVISPLTVYASEEPKAVEPPAYECVKDLLDEEEVVKATDLELEVGQDFDVSTDFRFLYKGIIINHNKKPSQPTLKRRFFKKKAAFFHGPVWERSGADFILKRKGEFF